MALILHLFTDFNSFGVFLEADYVTVVKDRPPKLTHLAARSLCGSWATYCYYHCTYLHNGVAKKWGATRFVTKSRI